VPPRDACLLCRRSLTHDGTRQFFRIKLERIVLFGVNSEPAVTRTVEAEICDRCAVANVDASLFGIIQAAPVAEVAR